MFAFDPFGLPISNADLAWAYLPPARDASDRDPELEFEDWVDAAQDAQ